MLNQLASLSVKSGLTGFWIAKEVISVIIPGIIILLELALLLHPTEWSQILNFVTGVSAGGVLLSSIIGVCLAYVIGHLVRTLEFNILGWATEPQSVPEKSDGEQASKRENHRAFSTQTNCSNDWKSTLKTIPNRLRILRCNWKSTLKTIPNRLQILRCRCGQATVWKRFEPHKSEAQIRKELEETLGKDLVTSFLGEYKFLGRLLAPEPDPEKPITKRKEEGPPPPRRGGAHQDTPSLAAFNYAKHWLRQEAPAFGVENHELSINIAASFMAPLLLLLVTYVRISIHNDTLAISMTVVVATITVMGLRWCFVDFRKNREWERRKAIENMILVWEIRMHSLDIKSAKNVCDP